jgi:3-mercaptopropionate dioxygenase
MLAQSFAGCDVLIDAADRAVKLRDPEALVQSLRSSMCKLIRSGEVRLPDCCFHPQKTGYARRELYRSEELGYSVIAMTWAPGQGTMIHDHCGMWCVEGVFAGAIEVVQYELTAQEGERYRFEERGSIQAGVGSAGSLIPPHEYHTIANPFSDEIAVSVHVYSATMTQCHVFEPQGGNWYQRVPKALGLDELI